MEINKELVECGTGDEEADKLINAVRVLLGKGRIDGRRANNCVAGDVIELEHRKTGVIRWGVVITPMVLKVVFSDGIKKTKLCRVKDDYKVKFWR